MPSSTVVPPFKEGRVIDGEVTKYNVVNVFPEGASGLKASRWATPAQPTPSQATEPQPGLNIKGGLMASRWAIPAAPGPTPKGKSTRHDDVSDQQNNKLTFTAVSSEARPQTVAQTQQQPTLPGPSAARPQTDAQTTTARGLKASRWATSSAEPTSPRQPVTLPSSAPSAARPQTVAQTATTHGLKASRWATPAAHQTPPRPTPSAARPQTEAQTPEPFKFSPTEVDTVTVVNVFPPGAKGLKASRWAAPPAQQTTTRPTPSAARPETEAQTSEPFKFSPKEVDTVTVVNVFPPGAKGLKASRWA